jgi:hypothetical protein
MGVPPIIIENEFLILRTLHFEKLKTLLIIG